MQDYWALIFLLCLAVMSCTASPISKDSRDIDDLNLSQNNIQDEETNMALQRAILYNQQFNKQLPILHPFSAFTSLTSRNSNNIYDLPLNNINNSPNPSSVYQKRQMRYHQCYFNRCKKKFLF